MGPTDLLPRGGAQQALPYVRRHATAPASSVGCHSAASRLPAFTFAGVVAIGCSGFRANRKCRMQPLAQAPLVEPKGSCTRREQGLQHGKLPANAVQSSSKPRPQPSGSKPARACADLGYGAFDGVHAQASSSLATEDPDCMRLRRTRTRPRAEGVFALAEIAEENPRGQHALLYRRVYWLAHRGVGVRRQVSVSHVATRCCAPTARARRDSSIRGTFARLMRMLEKAGPWPELGSCERGHRARAASHPEPLCAVT